MNKFLIRKPILECIISLTNWGTNWKALKWVAIRRSTCMSLWKTLGLVGFYFFWKMWWVRGCASGLEYQISLLLLLSSSSSSSSAAYERKRVLPPHWQTKWIWKTPSTKQKGLFDNEILEFMEYSNRPRKRERERVKDTHTSRQHVMLEKCVLY